MESGTTIQRYLEAATYTILVNSSQVGKFTLTSTFTPEVNALCTNFGRIGAGQIMNGTLAAASCKLPDGSLFDGWQTTVYGAGTLTITMHSTALDSFLILRNDTANVIAMDDNSGGGNDAQISVPVSGGQNYTIIASVASPTSKGGAYQISTVYTPADGETCLPVRTFTDPLQINGSISAASCNFNLPDRQDSSLFNFYGIHAASDGVVQIAVPTSTFTPLLLLLDANGNSIVEDSESGGAYIPQIKQPVKAGDYWVIIFNEDSFDGDYSLQYNFTPGPAQPCSVQDLSPNQPITGILNGDTSCRMSELLSDTYRLVLASPGTIDVGLSSADFSTFLELRDAKDNLLLYGDQTAAGSSAHLEATLPSGTYSVIAASVDLPGNYSISAQVTLKPQSPCATIQNLPVNTAFIGNFTSGSNCTGPVGEAVDYYKFTTTADGTAAIVMTSSDVDSHLTLTDSTGKILRVDDNSYGQQDAIIVQILKAGTYKVEARGTSVTGLEHYRVDLLFTANAKPPFCSATAIKIGATKNSTLAYTACQYYDDTFADIYQFQVSDSSKPVSISAVSGSFDAYLVLTDAKGNVIATDDNSGGGTNASLSALLDPGFYFIAVKPADDPSQSGSYQLQISQ